MYLRYGNYIHANNEVGFTISRDAKRSQGGTFYAYQEKWACRGLVQLRLAGGHLRAIENITAAYSIDGQDLVFLFDDGVTPTAHQLISANCNGGTRVTRPPSFPDTYKSGEYQPGYGRSYTFEIEGETPLTSDNVLLTFTESSRSKATAARSSFISRSLRARGFRSRLRRTACFAPRSRARPSDCISIRTSRPRSGRTP